MAPSDSPTSRVWKRPTRPMVVNSVVMGLDYNHAALAPGRPQPRRPVRGANIPSNRNHELPLDWGTASPRTEVTPSPGRGSGRGPRPAIYNAQAMNAPNADLLLAQQWLARLAEQAGGPSMGPAELALPPRWVDAAAALAGLVLADGKQIQIVVPDDETLPELSNALDIDLRPLCLVLPEADFATRIALRATLTLLKSRLGRHADMHPVWESQRSRIERLAGSWQAALAWGQSETEAIWPDDI